MYYVVELGWGKKTKGSYTSRCYAGVGDNYDGTYRIYGVQYVNRPGPKWRLNSGSVWQLRNPNGKISGELKKNRRVYLDHCSIDRVVRAVVLSVHQASPPLMPTSPLVLIYRAGKARF